MLATMSLRILWILLIIVALTLRRLHTGNIRLQQHHVCIIITLAHHHMNMLALSIIKNAVPKKRCQIYALLVHLQLQRAKVPTLTLVTENQVHNNMTGCVQNVMSHRGLWIIQHIHLIRHHQGCLQTLLRITLALGNKDTSILPHLHHTITLAHHHHNIQALGPTENTVWKERCQLFIPKNVQRATSLKPIKEINLHRLYSRLTKASPRG
mmetsp:Transcript_3508/g.7713  ORF Transcript_3508/g.7713 Transcript_3508/m.7713 type:complete len:210 (-) Transcript_3508:203-832(-)